MFEKYDVRRVGPGTGGEYDVQTGFGWTNGVAISLLARYVCSSCLHVYSLRRQVSDYVALTQIWDVPPT